MSRSILALRRISAFCVDWLVIVLWGGTLFVVAYLYHGGMPQQFTSPWIAQGVGFLAMTLPVILYFSLMECSASGGTLGKRVMRLRVIAWGGGRLGFKSSLLRSAIKFAPWEVGHLVAQQAFYIENGSTPTWLYLPMALSIAMPLWWLLSLFRTTQTPYDVLASSRVSSSLDIPLPGTP